MNKQQPAGRLEALDLLRLFAALAVVLFHWGFRTGVTEEAGRVAYPLLQEPSSFGYLGVSVFFVISGYVIAISAQGKTSARFLLARFARLWPAYIVCMSITALVMFWLGVEGTSLPAPDWKQWAANLTMVSPVFGQSFMDGAYWSIVYELTFYFWVAALSLRGFLWRRTPEILCLWVVLAVLNEFLLENGALQKLFVTDAAALFSCGVLLFHMKGRLRLENGKVNPLLALLVIFMAVAAAMEVKALEYGREVYSHDASALLTVLALISGLLLTFAAIRMKRMPLPLPLLLALGGISYPLYLMHQHIGYLGLLRLWEAGVSPAAAFVLMLAAVFIAAWAVYRFVEPAGRNLIIKLFMPLATRVDVWTAAFQAKPVSPQRIEP